MPNFEIKRRIVHSAGVFIPVLYLLNIATWTSIGLIIFILTVTVLILEYFRLKKNYTNIIYEKLTRSYESEKIAGYALYMVGMLIAWILYSPIAAVSGMLLLSLGDPISGIIGSLKNEDNKWILRFSVVIMFTIIILPLNISELGYTIGTITAIFGALGAFVVDEFKPKINDQIIDDNLTIPVVSGLIITVILYLA